MDKYTATTLFCSVFPGFIESEAVRNMTKDTVFSELTLDLSVSHADMYSNSSDVNVRFGFYDGDKKALLQAVSEVEPDWVKYFDSEEKAFCAFIGDEPVSFCLITDMGEHTISGRRVKIGGPGCVGTVPSKRCHGIGLALVREATLILKERGYDYSYIHYTHIPEWYKKLGYETLIEWNRTGII